MMILNVNEISQLKAKFCGDYSETYTEIYKFTKKILKEYCNKSNITLTFPVNIRGMIAMYGIEIVEMNLNTDIGFRMERINGYLWHITQYSPSQWKIYINAPDSEFTKRYVMAHEFSHFLLKQDVQEDCVPIQENCIDPMLPKKKTELLADVMAAYFLMPPELLLDEMCRYREKMRKTNYYPIDAAAFLQDIGCKAQISTYHSFLCYQYVRYYLCCLYGEKSKEVEEPQTHADAVQWMKKYGNLFRE